MSKIKRGWQDSDDHFLYDAEVHYLWINHTPDTGDRALPLCTVELERFKRPFENTRKYPNEQFTLWIDFNYLDNMSKFWLVNYFENAAPPNFDLRDLNEIEAYGTSQRIGIRYNRLHDSRDAYKRANLARFYILQDRLKRSDATNIVYSDLDATKVLNMPRAGKSLFEEQGFVIGKASNAIISHAYVALKNGHSQAKKFIDEVVTRTCEYYDQNNHGTNGPIVKGVIKDMLGEGMIRKMTVKPMPPIGYKTPKDRFLRFHGIR